ncbi:MAG TPA: glycerol kinase GlpK, partial [Candidatus Synoicihabitans sp.]|nr:glycerol kinase GlpK [Candidatus Synoicihabitans sp.]
MSTPRYVLALDQGTTSSRAIVFDRAGRTIAVAQKEFRQSYPKPGWVEHDPLEIWASQSATAAEAMSQAGLTARDLAAVGITNQRETVLVWERDTGRPIHPAIVWQDRRTADVCRRLQQDGVEPMISDRTGLRLDPYFSATKLRWLLDNVAGARRKAEDGRLLAGTVDTWLLWQLSGRKTHATDATNASRTLLFNLVTGDWDDELLQLFRIPRAMLPEIRDCSGRFCEIDRSLYAGGVPVSGVAGDQQAALFGQACFQPGMAKNTYGTGCFLLLQTGAERVPSRNNLLTTVAWRIGGRTEYALEGSVFIAGAAVQWLRDELQLVHSTRELDELASSVPDAGGLYLVPAFAGLGAPHWDPYARGLAIGITRGTNRAHWCRAALEGIAYQCADLIRAMEKDSGLEMKELRVDGGAARSQPLLQFQADLLGRRVVRPREVETTALGAAYLAGLAEGYWESRDEIARNWAVDATFERQRPAEEMAKLSRGWERALERAKGWEE